MFSPYQPNRCHPVSMHFIGNCCWHLQEQELLSNISTVYSACTFWRRSFCEMKSKFSLHSPNSECKRINWLDRPKTAAALFVSFHTFLPLILSNRRHEIGKRNLLIDIVALKTLRSYFGGNRILTPSWPDLTSPLRYWSPISAFVPFTSVFSPNMDYFRHISSGLTQFFLSFSELILVTRLRQIISPSLLFTIFFSQFFLCSWSAKSWKVIVNFRTHEIFRTAVAVLTVADGVNTMRSKSRCVLIKGVGSQLKEP
jgi:hypothetical protein